MGVDVPAHRHEVVDTGYVKAEKSRSYDSQLAVANEPPRGAVVANQQQRTAKLKVAYRARNLR